jgi:hypothetical protein
MLESLVSFWRECDLNKPPFLHPYDRVEILKRDPSIIHQTPLDFGGFARKPGFSDQNLHLNLIPQPYGGDLKNAEVFILLINPGLGFTDYWGEEAVSGFRDRLKNNLHQNFIANQEFRFPWLDPTLCWHGGFVWWEKKLRDVIRIIAEKRFDNNYYHALSAVSTKIASIELVPYHSFSFGAHSLIKHLRSVELVKQFVKGHLAVKAQDGAATLIVTRQVETWGLQHDNKNIFCYSPGQSRTASLTANSDGGKAILRRFDIHFD